MVLGDPAHRPTIAEIAEHPSIVVSSSSSKEQQPWASINEFINKSMALFLNLIIY